MKGIIKRTTGKSEANTAKTVESPEGSPKKLLQVTVAFSNTPSYVGTDLKVRINSGAGSEYDVTLQTGTSNEPTFFYNPTGDVILMDDDHIDVVVPAVGAGITSAVTIITQEIGY